MEHNCITCEWNKYRLRGRNQQTELKKGSSICCLQDSHLRFKNINKLKVKREKKIYRANSNHKTAGAPMLVQVRL